MPTVEAFVRRVEDVEPQSWNDRRGRLSFQTLVSGDTTPSDSLVAGISIVEAGGVLALHSHAQAEIYFVVEGAGLVTIDDVEHKVSSGATLFIPGDARHCVRNPFEATFRFFYVFAADRFDDIRYNFVDSA
jgi:mannose-6-phosphate isomerase-like protein (cupin superfamily)